ncbi:MAG: shikimate kinase, partial [Afipia sp.]
AIASRDVPHEKIVDECIDALAAHLVSGAASSSSSETQ